MKFNPANVATMLCAMQKRKVVVLGDIMLDRFIDGTVTRISPEAPVPIISQSKISSNGGWGSQCGLQSGSIGTACSFDWRLRQ